MGDWLEEIVTYCLYSVSSPSKGGWHLLFTKQRVWYFRIYSKIQRCNGTHIE